MTQTEQAQAALDDLVRWIDGKLDKAELKIEGDRDAIAMGCFDVALEHQAACAVLHNVELYGSLNALLRVLFEAVVRGMWIRHCAAESEVDCFKKGRIDTTFGGMIEAVEKRMDLSNGVLSKLKSKTYRALNAFTHTGFLQVTRRHGEGTLGSHYTDDERVQALNMAAFLGLLAAVELGDMCRFPVAEFLERADFYASITQGQPASASASSSSL